MLKKKVKDTIKSILKKILNVYSDEQKKFEDCIKKLHKFVLYNKIRKKEISIISNNCSSVFLYKEIECKYFSPTVNLQFSPSDYIKFCNNLDYYLSKKIEEVKNPDISLFAALGGARITFPVGKLDDLIIYFQHYTDFATAESKWEERKKRINHKELFFILIDTFCNRDTVEEFFNLPYRNKLFMTGNKDLLLNDCCILIEKDKKPWFEGDWMGRFNFRKWFLKNK